MSIARYVLPVVVGAMAGMMLIAVGQWAMSAIYPLPPGTDLQDMKSVAKAMAAMPAGAYGVLLANYIICSFCAGLVATLVAKRVTARPAVVVGMVLTLAGLYNVISLPQPLWFSITNLLVYLPFSYLGYLAVRRKEVVPAA